MEIQQKFVLYKLVRFPWLVHWQNSAGDPSGRSPHVMIHCVRSSRAPTTTPLGSQRRWPQKVAYVRCVLESSVDQAKQLHRSDV